MKRALTAACAALSMGAVALTVTGAPSASAADDLCPYGWSAEQTVWFDGPDNDSGVANREGVDGCSILDRVWEGEPFSSHDAFIARVAQVIADFRTAGLISAGEGE